MLAGTIRAVVNHCNFDEAEIGLLVGFASKAPGQRAALWVRTQNTDSCGTFVSFGFTKVEYRVTPAGIEARQVPAPKGMNYDRTAPFSAR